MPQMIDQQRLQHSANLKRISGCSTTACIRRATMVCLCALSLAILGGCTCGQSCSRPKTQKSASQSDATVIQLDQYGQIRCAGKTYAVNEVDALMRQLAVQNKQQALLIKADPNTPFTHAIALMDAAKSAGLTRISVATSNTNNSEL